MGLATTGASAPFKMQPESLLKFCQVPWARQGLAQRPHRERGNPSGELVIPWRQWCLLWVTPELHSCLDAESAILDYEVWMIFGLSELKKPTSTLWTSHFILFPWQVTLLGNYISLTQVLAALSTPSALEYFLPVDPTVTSDEVSMIHSGIYCRSQHYLNPHQRKALYAIKIVCMEIDENRLSHLFLWIFIAPRS